MYVKLQLNVFNCFQEDLLIKILTLLKSNINEMRDPAIRLEFLQKIRRFQKVKSLELQHAFLDLVYDIHKEPLNGDEKLYLKGTVFIGLSARNPELRKKFFTSLNNEIQPNLEHRLNIVLSAQTWETIGHVYWIQQALSLILGLHYHISKAETRESGMDVDHAPSTTSSAPPESSPPLQITRESAKLTPLPIPAAGTTELSTISPEAKAIFDRHEEFLRKVQSPTTWDFLVALMALIHDVSLVVKNAKTITGSKTCSRDLDKALPSVVASV